MSLIKKRNGSGRNTECEVEEKRRRGGGDACGGRGGSETQKDKCPKQPSLEDTRPRPVKEKKNQLLLSLLEKETQ